ncbi:MAG: replication-associated recombination protein A [Desulfovibrionales bacterium]|nr:replication-associated recombination protein A [Desulfovibrionales bacterium]
MLQAINEARTEAKQPLADKIRPDSFDDFSGQEHLSARITALTKASRLPSLLLFGPPGCGKSTLALLLAKHTGLNWLRVSAPEAGLTQLRKSLKGVEVLVLDELHRFSKAQQDFFLPILESGEITLFATTTENPSFSVTRQLLSRLHTLQLKPLPQISLQALAKKGAEACGVELDESIYELVAGIAHGDARTMLNLVEYIAQLPAENRAPDQLKAVLPDVIARHDKNGDSHYELASAMIKSIRGSDVDAAMYYLASLLEGGEDPRFICRRLILSASEDIGLADPQALTIAVSCQQAVEFVGMPEGFIPLAETVTYLALAPKSNSTYAAYLAAAKEIRAHGRKPVPLHLRNPSTKLQKQWGYGKGYLYPHNYPEGYVPQQYLPDDLVGRMFYQHRELGVEPRLAAWLARTKKNFR